MRNILHILRVSAAGVGAAGVAITPGVASAVSGTIPSPAMPAAGTALSQAAAIQNGDLAEQVVPHADGSVEYVYSSPLLNGQMRAFKPPTGFSPLMASAATLQKYGFPPRPSGGPALQQWITAMSAYKDTVTPKLTIQVGMHTSSLRGGRSSDTAASPAAPFATSRNWAGYVDTPGANGGYVAASAGTVVPKATGTSCGSTSVDDAWVGLGGTSISQPLIQDGVAWNAPTPTAWTAWYEVMKANESGNVGPVKISTSALALTEGDDLYMYVGYIPSADEAAFYIENTNTGQVSQKLKASIQVPGSPRNDTIVIQIGL